MSKYWKNRGVSLECMLETAMSRPDELEALVQQVGNEDYARLLFDITRYQKFMLLEQLLSTWLTRIWESIRERLQLDITNQNPGPDFEASINAMLARLVRLMARNPTRVPSLPPRPKQQAGDTERFMNRSLLPCEVLS